MTYNDSKYKSFKKILFIIETGDIHDNRYKLLIQVMNLSEVEFMRKFVEMYEQKRIEEYAN